MKEIISTMEIYFAKEDLMVEEIILMESQVDYTRIIFSGRKINEAIADSVFSIDG
jgi:outer membrane lipoprotein-sorting protein